MEMDKKTIKHADMEIDFSKVLKKISADKKNVLLYCAIAAFIGIVVAFSIPNEYKTNVMLAPETSGSSLTSSNLSSIASMIGMDVKSMSSDDALYPEIYPDLMNSMDFITSLFNVKVKSIDGNINTTFSDYIEKYQRIPWWSYPQVWIKKLIDVFNTNKTTVNASKVDPFELTKDQYDIAMSIRNLIKCSVDKKSDIIKIEVTVQDPLISATMADSVKMRLQSFITNYRTNKARHDVTYMQKLFDEARSQYVKSRQLYGSYSDANQELVLESYKVKQEDLENEMQLKYNMYTQMAQQLQMAKAKVEERTPVFTVVQSASVPLKKNNIPKIYIVFLFMIVGFIIRTIILLARKEVEQDNNM